MTQKVQCKTEKIKRIGKLTLGFRVLPAHPKHTHILQIGRLQFGIRWGKRLDKIVQHKHGTFGCAHGKCGLCGVTKCPHFHKANVTEAEITMAEINELERLIVPTTQDVKCLKIELPIDRYVKRNTPIVCT